VLQQSALRMNSPPEEALLLQNVALKLTILQVLPHFLTTPGECRDGLGGQNCSDSNSLSRPEPDPDSLEKVVGRSAPGKDPHKIVLFQCRWMITQIGSVVSDQSLKTIR
jgi:hypothetical protein